MKKQIIIADFISAILLLLFTYTAIYKFSDQKNFQFVLSKSPLLHPFAFTFSWALPLIEIIISFLLFIPACRFLGLYASLILLSVFNLYLGYMVLFTTARPCGCGGVISSLTWPQHILFNLLFILHSVFGILLYKKNLKVIKPTPP